MKWKQGVRKEQHYESIIPLMDQISLYSMIFLLIPITCGGKTYEKKMVFLIVIISLTLIGVTIMIILLNNGHEIKEFTISDYQYYIDNYGTEKYLGSVVDYRDAEKKAESFWLELYGKDIKNKRPYVTSFDSNNEIWLVSGSLQKNTLGGVPYILLRKSDGKVLAVWHEK